jgi:hypothetical protein
VDEVDLYDFVLLEILQVFFPEIYQDIWQNPRFYVPASTSEDMLSSPFLLLMREISIARFVSISRRFSAMNHTQILQKHSWKNSFPSK